MGFTPCEAEKVCNMIRRWKLIKPKNKRLQNIKIPANHEWVVCNEQWNHKKSEIVVLLEKLPQNATDLPHKGTHLGLAELTLFLSWNEQTNWIIWKQFLGYNNFTDTKTTRVNKWLQNTKMLGKGFSRLNWSNPISKIHSAYWAQIGGHEEIELSQVI